MDGDVKWLIGIIIVLGIISISLRDSGFSLLGQRTSLTSSQRGSGDEKIDWSLDINRDGVIDEEERALGELRELEESFEDIGEELEEIQEFSQASVYADQIRLRAGSTRTEDRRKEYVFIDSLRNNLSGILITGWRLMSPVSSRNVKIKEGAQLPFIGRVNKTGQITLLPGDRAIVNSGASPIGVSFLLNKCTGYFEQHQNFSPRLPRKCPRPVDEDLSAFGITIKNLGEEEYDECVEYIRRIPRCSIFPTDQDLEDECNEYINKKINYNTCVELHKNDADFYGNEWRIFINASDELWRKKDEIIRLLDLSGRIVDSVSY